MRPSLTVAVNTDIETVITEYIHGVVVWQTPSISNDFPGQTVQLTANSNAYNWWEVLYLAAKNSKVAFSTGKLPIILGSSTYLHAVTDYAYTRSAKIVDNTVIFSECEYKTAFGSAGNKGDNSLIPYIIRLYK